MEIKLKKVMIRDLINNYSNDEEEIIAAIDADGCFEEDDKSC